MRHLYVIACLLVAIVANAQYEGPGFYRVHNVGSDAYICIRGTHFEKTTTPDAFWSCVKMQLDSAQVVDPGSIIYIPGTDSVGLYAQGVDTYTLTTLPLDVRSAPVSYNGVPAYVAYTQYFEYPTYFRDYGNGMTAGSSARRAECHWFIEPLTEAAMDSSYWGVCPESEAIVDADGWYWTTMCCDFPFLIPVEGGVEGAYTVKEVIMGTDSLYYAAPVKVYGQGEIVPAATPVLLKCKAAYASGNKLIPTGEIANNRTFPIVSDMLQGNYFSIFTNHADLNDYSRTKEYLPEQATPASDTNLALGVDSDGKLGFFPKEEGTYMNANSAWLSIEGLELNGVTAIYLGEAPLPEPEPEILLGDASGDGKLTVKDASLIISYLLDSESSNEDNAGKAEKPEIDLVAADVNCDGRISIKDLSLLLAMLLETQEIDEQ